MERLTYKLGESNPTYGLEDKASAKIGLFTDYDGWFAYHVAIRKLGQYEDTGIAPDEITRLRAELEREREQKEKAIADLRESADCSTCKHNEANCNRCDKATAWEWRGEEGQNA